LVEGDGVLDLSSTRVAEYMHILDFKILTNEQAQQIKDAFFPMTQRNLMNIADELDSQDRQHFDETVINVFGLDVTREQVYDSLLKLVEIRNTVLDIFQEY